MPLHPFSVSVAASRPPASFSVSASPPRCCAQGWNPTNTRRSPLPPSAVLALQDRIEQFPSFSFWPDFEDPTYPVLQQHPTLPNNGSAPDSRLAAFHHYSCAPDRDTIGCTASILPCHSPKLNCLLRRRLSAESLDEARESVVVAARIVVAAGLRFQGWQLQHPYPGPCVFDRRHHVRSVLTYRPGRAQALVWRSHSSENAFITIEGSEYFQRQAIDRRTQLDVASAASVT